MVEVKIQVMKKIIKNFNKTLHDMISFEQPLKYLDCKYFLFYY